MQQQRTRNLTLLTNLSRNTAIQVIDRRPFEVLTSILFQTTFQAIIASHDLSLECFLLRFVIEKLAR